MQKEIDLKCCAKLYLAMLLKDLSLLDKLSEKLDKFTPEIADFILTKISPKIIKKFSSE